MRRVIHLLLQVVIPILVMFFICPWFPNSPAASVLSGLSCLWLPFGFWPSKWAAHLLAIHLVKSIRCPRCQCDIDAVSVWSSGSYTDYRERHVLAFRNPIDGRRIGWINCPNPKCKSTILL
jgi:hypothetical protein